jgi:hypothetical protein
LCGTKEGAKPRVAEWGPGPQEKAAKTMITLKESHRYYRGLGSRKEETKSGVLGADQVAQQGSGG